MASVITRKYAIASKAVYDHLEALMPTVCENTGRFSRTNAYLEENRGSQVVIRTAHYAFGASTEILIRRFRNNSEESETVIPLRSEDEGRALINALSVKVYVNEERLSGHVDNTRIDLVCVKDLDAPYFLEIACQSTSDLGRVIHEVLKCTIEDLSATQHDYTALVKKQRAIAVQMALDMSH